MRRLLIALLAVLATVLGSATLLAGPASAEDSTTSCTGVLSGQAGDENLADKSLVSMVDNGNGTYTFTYSVYVDRAPGSYRIRDCIWIDSDGNGAYNGETLVGSDEKDVDFVADGAGSSGRPHTRSRRARTTQSATGQQCPERMPQRSVSPTRATSCASTSRRRRSSPRPPWRSCCRSRELSSPSGSSSGAAAPAAVRPSQPDVGFRDQ